MSESLLDEFVFLLKLLIKTPSVVGCERAFMSLLQKECDQMGLQTELYEGVLEVCGGSADLNDITLSAHIDRHGLICTGPNEFQYAAFSAKHGSNLDGSSVSEKLLKSIEKRFIHHEVMAYDPWTGQYLGQTTITDAYICDTQNNLIFNIGEIDGMSPGIPLAYSDALTQDGDWISAQLDNVFSVAVILLLYKRGFRGRALFTCEEEAGKSWRYLQAYFRRKKITTDQLLVLDTSPFDDRALLQQYPVVLRNRDIVSSFNATFTDRLQTICNDLGVSSIKKDEYVQDPTAIGRTELGRLIEGSSGALSGTTFQFPTTDYHTDQETFFLPSLVASLSVLETLLLDK